MKKNKKIGLIIIAVIAAVLLILFLLGNYAKGELRDTIDENLAENLKYEELEVSLINSKVSLTNPEVFINKNIILAEELSIEGISYYQYFINDKIRIGIVELLNPEITLNDEKEATEEKEGKRGQDFSQDILVREFKSVNGKIRSPEKDTTGNKLFIALENFRMSNIAVNAKSLEEKIPFEYESYSFEIDSLKMELDDQHDFSTGKLSGNDGDFSVDDLRIMPKYGKMEFQKHIPYEKDRFDLFVENVSLRNLRWDFENDSLQIENDTLQIRAADLEVYRDKQAPDDPRRKTLYSEKIRNLPVKIDLQHIGIKKSKIVYQEKLEAGRPPGEVLFQELEGEIKQLTNMNMGSEDFPKTMVTANALFNNETAVQVEWEFDVSNKADAFSISGHLAGASANAINAFLRPAMNVEARGGIESLYFTFAGNDDSATGDVRIKYRDFKINILEDDGTEKSSFWSGLVNLFISNDAVNDDVNNQNLEVERNKKKSFWNYLWLMVREGALASFL